MTLSVQAGKQPKDTVLFNYGNKSVTTREFYKGFTKNKHKDSSVKATEVDEYLELYKKFKLKVQDAYDMGLDTTESFKTELATYRKQIAQQFLMDAQVNEKLISEAYERMKYEIKASHILIFARPDASPEDTLKAYKRLLNVKRLIESDSLTFENAALKFSEDPSAEDNLGNLGYFSCFQMIYEFESQAYNTSVGKVSKVFRTEFGYHIVKVYDKRPNMGEISLRVVKIELNPTPTTEEMEEARAKINEVYKRLQAGEKFTSLVQQYSEDAGSVLKNGQIPAFSMTSGRYPENFKNSAFALANDGDYSMPIQTAQGFYILQRITLKPLDSLNKIKSSIVNKISRDSRQYKNTLAVYEKAKKMYKFKENSKFSKSIGLSLDSSLLMGEFDVEKFRALNPKLSKTMLFSFTKVKKIYNMDSFANWLSKVQKPTASKALSSIIQNYYEAYRLQTVMDFYEADLENTSEKFATLYKEYKEGILLFTLTDRKVWSKSVEDTVGLKDFYDKNNEKYIHGVRYNATIYRCATRAIAEELKKDLESGLIVDSIMKKFYRMNPLAVSTPLTGKFEQGDNPYTDLAFQYGKPSMKYMIVEDPNVAGRFAVIQIHEMLPAGKKTLNEARGVIISDYQNYLEKIWLEALMTKYPISVNETAYNAIKAKMIKP
ncbi:MAG: peptidylprolyl isomerase [Bacteroidia bacterium]|nr:peptidylprolyl isomerase [Bacteroidia bacterium]